MRFFVVLLLAVATGCVTVETRVRLLRTEHRADNCTGSEIRGSLGHVENEQVALILSEQCAAVDVDTFQTRRTRELPFVVPVGVGGAVGLATGISLFFAVQGTGSQQGGAAELARVGYGIVFWLPAIAVGVVVLLALNAISIQQPDGELRVTRDPAPVAHVLAPGTVRSLDESSVELPTDGASVSMPLELMLRIDLNRVTFEGRRVVLDSGSQRRADGLASCRAAMEAAADDCAGKKRKFELAEECSDADWPFAIQLSRALRPEVEACSIYCEFSYLNQFRATCGPK